MITFETIGKLELATLKEGDLVQVLGEFSEGDVALMTGKVYPALHNSSNRLVTIANGLKVEVFPTPLGDKDVTKKYVNERDDKIKEQVNNLHTKREAIEWKAGLRVTDELQLYVHDGVEYLPKPDTVPYTTSGSDVMLDKFNISIAQPGRSVNLRKLGLLCDGITDESDELLDALAKNPNVYLDPTDSVRVTKSLVLPVSLESITGTGKILLDGDGANIRSTSNFGTPIAVVTGVAFSNNQYEIHLNGDYTGKYIYLENNLSWFIAAANDPSTPAGSMNPLGYTGNDDNFLTERRGLYKVVGHNSVNGMSILNMPTNFNAVSGTATIYADVNTFDIGDITIEHINHSQLTEIGSMSLSGCYGVNISRVNFVTCGAVRYYWLCTNSVFDNCQMEVDGGVWVSVNSRKCRVTNNIIEHGGNSDSALIFYYNACENVATGNTISGYQKKGDLSGKWGIMTHSASDYNTITGNNVTSTSGLCDFFSNKGNNFAGNTVNGQNGEISNYCFNTHMSGNVFNDAELFTVAGSKLVTIEGGGINQAKNSPSNKLFSAYDPQAIPFGYKGFFALTTSVVDLKNININGKGQNVNVRDYVTGTGSGNTFDMTKYEKDANYFIGSKLCRVLSIRLSGNTVNGFDCGVLNFNSYETAVTTKFTSKGNTYSNCDTAIAQAAPSVSKLKGISSLRDTFINTNICCTSENVWYYQSESHCSEIESIILKCGDAGELYTTIIDIKNLVENETKKFIVYDFGGEWDYYKTAVINAGAHSKCSNIPYGAEYYQISDNMHTSQQYLFINKINTYGGLVGNVTVRRTITEQQYG